MSAVKMADMMDIPVLGVIENYSYLTCPDCGRKIEVFGKSRKFGRLGKDNKIHPTDCSV